MQQQFETTGQPTPVTILTDAPTRSRTVAGAFSTVVLVLCSSLAFGYVGIQTQETGCTPGWEPDISINPTNLQNMIQVPYSTCAAYTQTALGVLPSWATVSTDPAFLGDPHVEFTANGNAYAVGLVFPSGAEEQARIYKSTNGGATWTLAGTALTSNSTQVTFGGSTDTICSMAEAGTIGAVPADFDKFGADRTATSSFANRLYFSAGVFLKPSGGSCDTSLDHRIFTYSSDGGVTWSRPVVHPNHSLPNTNGHWFETSDYAVMPDGHVFVSTVETGSGCIGVGARVSGDGGATYSPALTSTPECALNNPSGTGSYPDVGKVGIPGVGFVPAIAADPTTSGVLYIAFVGWRNWSTAQDAHIWFVKTTNYGFNWTAPVKVDSWPLGSTTSWQNLRGKKLSISATAGRLDVLWTDGRNTDSTHLTGGDYFYNRSFDGGATWGTDFAVNPHIFADMASTAGAVSGDYIVVQSDGLLAWASYDGLLLDSTKHNYLSRMAVTP